MSEHSADSHEPILVQKAREWFQEAVANEVNRRGQAKLVEQREIWNRQHVVMQHLSGAIPNAASLTEPELRTRVQKLAAQAVAGLIGDRKGEVLVVSAYVPRFFRFNSHVQYDWHAGAAKPGEVQHRVGYKD